MKIKEVDMKKIYILLIVLMVQGAGAQELKDQIHSIERGENGEPHLIKYSSGEVKFIDPSDQKELQEFEQALEMKRSLWQGSSTKLLSLDSEFEPTKVSDAQIITIFKNFNPYMRRKSECSDRAHVWAFDEFQRSGIKSEKAFLLLTDAYIRRNWYKWWFHVAPMFTSVSGEKIVMDYQFFDRPVTFKEWKNYLVFSQRECVTDFRFLDYDAGADQTQDCYVKFEPMYYYIPGDIGAREVGRHKVNWNTSQVNASRSRAFFKGIW